MFDTAAEATARPADLLKLAADTHRESKRTACHKLVLAAAWADLHSHVDNASGNLNAERLVEMGPQGCPSVAETAPTELAMAFQTSIGGAKALMRDALNLRHRLPRTWARVCAGEIHAWKARALAQRSAYLNVHAASELDRLLVNHLELVAWRRFEKMLDATLLHVDERTYRERAERMSTSREVWATESSDGLRTLVARADAGDVTIFLALVNRIAEVLADEGDEDPVSARRAKAIGIAGYPDRALDLLLRHRHQPDTHRHPEEQAADHLEDTDPATGSSDGCDPWAEGPPAAGWQNARYGNYSQPDSDDSDHAHSQQAPSDPDEEATEPREDSIDQADLDWLHGQTSDPDSAAPSPSSSESPASPPDPSPPGDRPPPGRRYANTGGIGLREALAAFAELDASALAAARPQIVMHVHLSDETVRAGRGVIRTAHGPITADQFRRFLGDTGGDITVRPVLDPASVAAVDGYEIPLELRRLMSIRHPASVFPYSPSTTRLDLDHSIPYRRGGPPGQTGPGKLGPLARCEHRSRTHGGCDVRQPDAGTFVWRTRHGWVSVVTNQGTLVLGDTPFARQIWQAADQAGPANRLLRAVS